MTAPMVRCDCRRPERGVPIDERMPTSTVLGDLLRHASTETITLAWLMGRLGERSFGLVLLLLGLLATLPGASVVAGILIAVPAFQMILGRHAPLFPRFLAIRSFKTRRLATMLDHANGRGSKYRRPRSWLMPSPMRVPPVTDSRPPCFAGWPQTHKATSKVGATAAGLLASNAAHCTNHAFGSAEALMRRKSCWFHLDKCHSSRLADHPWAWRQYRRAGSAIRSGMWLHVGLLANGRVACWETKVTREKGGRGASVTFECFNLGNAAH